MIESELILGGYALAQTGLLVYGAVKLGKVCNETETNTAQIKSVKNKCPLCTDRDN